MDSYCSPAVTQPSRSGGRPRSFAVCFVHPIEPIGGKWALLINAHNRLAGGHGHQYYLPCLLRLWFGPRKHHGYVQNGAWPQTRFRLRNGWRLATISPACLATRYQRQKKHSMRQYVPLSWKLKEVYRAKIIPNSLIPIPPGVIAILPALGRLPRKPPLSWTKPAMYDLYKI